MRHNNLNNRYHIYVDEASGCNAQWEACLGNEEADRRQCQTVGALSRAACFVATVGLYGDIMRAGNCEKKDRIYPAETDMLLGPEKKVMDPFIDCLVDKCCMAAPVGEYC